MAGTCCCFGGLVTFVAFILVVAVQSTKIEEIFRIGVYSPEKHDTTASKRLHLKTLDGYRELVHEKRMWEPLNQGAFSFCQLPDSVLTFCFVAVVSYIIYMAVAISLPAKPAESDDLKSNQGLKVLLADHRFRDNIIPAKIRNAYEISSSQMEQTSLGKNPIYYDGNEDKKPLIGNEDRVVTESTDAEGANTAVEHNNYSSETELVGTVSNGLTDDKGHRSPVVTL